MSTDTMQDAGAPPSPVPHPQSARCRVGRARDQLREQLTFLAGIEHELSLLPGTRPERRSDFWLGLIAGSATYLLWALDAEDAACGRKDG